MELNSIKNVYFVGIGGIGMSSLARYFRSLGCFVSGYDRTSTVLTESLIREGISIVFNDDIDTIPEVFRNQSNETLIVFTPAIPRDSLILNYFDSEGFDIKKRSQVLGMISSEMFTVAVAGTHGKTTTSTIIAHIFKHSAFDCSAFLGGIATNYNTNFLIGKNNVMVVEADEYDRSFLQLHPDIAVITSMDADHLDIYGDNEKFKDSFQLFASQLKPGGSLIYKNGLSLSGGTTYSAFGEADIRAENIRVDGGNFYFDFVSTSIKIENILIGIPGHHNVENAIAAIQVSLFVGIAPEKIKRALAEFQGIKRRFEYIIKTEKQVYIDDYAHHPTELHACITAVRSLYPGRKLTTVFQPHLFSRTRDFAHDFSAALSLTDELILLDIYPARELPIPGITSDMLLENVTIERKIKCGKQEAVEFVRRHQPDLLLTVGAGDIDTLVQPFKNALSHA
jgi:UDP-N-acetylmuramate--alanine ligase